MKLRITNYELRITGILCILCVLCGSMFAQKRSALGWAWQNPLPQGNPLFSINFAKDKNTGFAVGADGTILRTDNGGFNWRSQMSPVNTIFSSVYVKDSLNAVAVGARGVILQTTDGGKNWVQRVTEAKDHL